MTPNVLAEACASRRCLRVIGDKWSLLVIYALRDGLRRNGDLVRTIEGISQKMLTQTLRQLEEMNIVLRHDFAVVPPHVEYALTPLGMALAEEVSGLINWVQTHAPDLGKVGREGGTGRSSPSTD
jgi:DNA-binding HxlR family transcriptional regulator